MDIQNTNPINGDQQKPIVPETTEEKAQEVLPTETQTAEESEAIASTPETTTPSQS